MIDIDLSEFVTDFSEEVILYRYQVEYDDNGHRIIDENNPTTYSMYGSVQQTEKVLEWVEEGTNLDETRVLFVPYPYELTDGTTVEIQMKTRQTVEEDVPVDGIEYKGVNYDLVQKVADYPQYGYEQFVIQRVR